MSTVPIVKATANGSLKANQQKELSSIRLIETTQRFGGQSLNQNSFSSGEMEGGRSKVGVEEWKAYIY